MKIKLIMISMFIAVLFSGCVKFPQIEIDSATVAVQEVKDAGADLYVPEFYNLLTDSLEASKVLVEADKSKLFKTYKASKQALSGVINLASEVKVKSDESKAVLKIETDSLLVNVKELVAETKVLVEKAPKGKGEKSALEAINSEVTSIESNVVEADTLLVNGSIFEANSKVKAAIVSITVIKTELETVITKTK
jgi:hypothetical protein